MKHTLLTLMFILLASSPLCAQREVYERYAPREDLLVAYAHGYRLDSTTRVDAILLQAKDSAAWEWMQEEFHIARRGKSNLVGLFADHDDPTRPINLDKGSLPCIALIASFDEQYIGLFFVETDEQIVKIWYKVSGLTEMPNQ